MASAGEDEKISLEIPERRTRSGRKVMPVVPAVSTRTRRNKKDATQAPPSIAGDNIIEEEHEELASKKKPQQFAENLQQSEDMLKEILNVVTNTAATTNESHKNEAELLTNENAVGLQTESIELVEEIVDYNNDEKNYATYQEQELPEVEEDVEMYDEEQNNAEVPLAAEAGIDDKSSSFPFGTAAGQSESSEEAQNEEDTSGEKSAVDGSLLASLAGDNANSLPSVGGGEELDVKKDDFTTTKDAGGTEFVSSNRLKSSESEDSLSEPAIAESLNDITDASNATNVHTEMVSEDELPLPTKPEINDAEEVSDDELPAPKRAELPADAEVISEDELPLNAEKKSPIYSSNKDTLSPPIESGKKKRKAADKNNGDLAVEKHHKTNSNSNNINNSDVKRENNEDNNEYNPMSPTSESDDSAPTEKKAKLDAESVEKEKQREKEKEKKEEKIERKRLPDLDKYWRPVKEDPADFTGWTYLLQYVDNESDAEAAREAYDAFLAHYPYCYGYWRKYADFEKRKGIKANCNVVFQRGLEAIPLSVDLWIHYLTHVKNTQPDDENLIRTQFERAINACGLEFRSDKLWDAYIKWETDAKRYDRVLQIYDRLLALPTQGYSGHFDNFQDLINQHPLNSLLTDENLKKLRLEVREGRKLASRRSNSKEKEEPSKNDSTIQPQQQQQLENSDKIVDESDTVTADANRVQNIEKDDLNEVHDSGNVIDDSNSTLNEEEIAAIKSRIISMRRKIHKNTVAAVTARWTFEEGIKRPYFHVKPLERCQLKNWKDYLDFEIERGDRKRILVLFERCLIACALYDEFWLKMLRYLESETDQPDNVQITRDVFRRACEIHHPDKPSLHLMWAAFEECQNNFDRAAEVLVNLERKCPNLLQVAYRRINVERRRGDLNKCRELYEHYISSAKNKTIAGSLAIKYARFLNKICHDLEGGVNVLRKALEKDTANTRVALQMIDLALQRNTVNEEEIVDIMEHFMEREGMDPEQKVLFAQRKVEFLEDFGSTAKGLQDAQRALQLALTKANEAKKKRESSPNRKLSGANAGQTSTSSAQLSAGGYNSSNNVGTAAASSGYNYANSTNSAYYGQGGNSGYQQQQQQQSYDSYYNHWQYGSNYSGYGQWSGYGNYY